MEKTFKWTDKTGRGEKTLSIDMEQLKLWNLEEESWFDVPLGEYIEDAYVGSTWETTYEKLECVKIVDE